MYVDIQREWNESNLEQAAHGHLISPAEEMARLGTSGDALSLPALMAFTSGTVKVNV